MIDLEFSFLGLEAIEIGHWLDPQRWSVGVSDDGRSGIQFANDLDATLFLLRWSKQKVR